MVPRSQGATYTPRLRWPLPRVQWCSWRCGLEPLTTITCFCQLFNLLSGGFRGVSRFPRKPPFNRHFNYRVTAGQTEPKMLRRASTLNNEAATCVACGVKVRCIGMRTIAINHEATDSSNCILPEENQTDE